MWLFAQVIKERLHHMKYNDQRNELIDVGDYNDVPTDGTLWAAWLIAATLGASSVLFAIGGAL